MRLSPGVLLILAGSLVLLLLTFCPRESRAQAATLRGFVADASSGEPLELVNVILRSLRDGHIEGAVTSGDGVYAFPRIDPGRYAVQASFIGYTTFRDTLDMAPGEVRALNIALAPDPAALDEVVVEDERMAGAARVAAGRQTIRPAEIELVPSPDLSADLAGYLTTLPGIVTMGDRGGQLFIRGGEPSQNLVLLDGMPVYQPFHMLGFYSSFPADVLRSADLYAGGFGAEYGGRLSSVLDVLTRNGNNRSFAGSVSLSPFVSSVQLEGPIVPKHASLLVSARRSFLEAAEQLTGESLPLTFGDAFAKLHVEPGRTSRLSVTALNTYDRGALAEGASGSAGETLRWQNQAVGGRFVALPRFAPFVGEIQLSYSRLRSEQGPSHAPVRSSTVTEIQGSATGTFFGGGIIDTEVGMMLNLLSLKNELGGTFQDTYFEDAAFQNVTVYVQPNITPVAGLSIKPGLRFQLYRLDMFPHVEPRLRIVWERGRHQVSAATGLYHQEVVGISDRRDATSVFTVWSTTPGVGARDGDIEAGRLGRAVHALLGYRISPLTGLDVSVEGFYKKIDHIFVPEWTAYPRLTTRLQPADGRSYGFDARLSGRAGTFYGQVGYGFSNTLYEARRARYELWYGTETLRYRPPHDRRHQLSALAGTSLAGFDVNVRWQFGSGLPFSQARGFGGFVFMDDPFVDVAEQGTRRVIYERPFNALLPTFHRLDVSVERTFTLPYAALTLQASAINAYDRRNIFYLDLFTLQRADQLPFIPSVGLKVSFE